MVSSITQSTPHVGQAERWDTRVRQVPAAWRDRTVVRVRTKSGGEEAFGGRARTDNTDRK